MKRQKSKSFSPSSFQVDKRPKKGKALYVCDSKLLPRLQEFLSGYTFSRGRQPSLDDTVDHLQETYREYSRKKRSAFRISVQKVYVAIKNENAEDRKLQELEDNFLGKRQQEDSFITIDLSDPEDRLSLSCDSELSEDERRKKVPYGNLVNQSMHQMYKTSNSRRTSEDEAGSVAPKDTDEISDLQQNAALSEIIVNKCESSPADNQNNINDNEATMNSIPEANNIATDSRHIPDINSTSERPGASNETPMRDRRQDKRSAKKDRNLARLKEAQKKTGGKDILLDDAEKIPSVPEMKFSDLGGCGDCIQEVCKLLIHIKHPEVFNALGITPPRGFLLHGPPGCGKSLFAHAIAGELEVPIINIASTEMVSGISGESEGKIRDVFKRACAHSPCVLFLDEIDAITPKRETASKEMERRIVAQLLSCMDELNRNKEAQVLVIGATNRPDSLDPALRRAGRFDREIRMGIPDEQAREEILRVQCKDLKLNEELDFKTLASQTPGFVGADLTSLVREAAMCAVTRIFNSVGTSANETNPTISVTITKRNIMDLLKSNEAVFSEEQLKDLNIKMEDFVEALRDVQPSAKREGFATIPDVTWEDIGALHDIREELTMAIIAPVRHREAFTQLGLTNPPGILLAGPPGCGKTLLAKAIANESGINFISVKGPELLNMYVGESERAVRQVFQRAKNSAPCVIFFDELDALCPRRSQSSESTASARVVNQLLTEMDGLETRKQVFIMGATNRPDIIDPAILRPGRLDKVLYVGLPQEKDRLAILRTITKSGTKPKLLADVDLNAIAADKHCHGFSGADLAALVREASVNALRECMKGCQGTSVMMWDMTGSDGTQQDAVVGVAMRHFDAAFTKIKPSVSEKDQLVYQYMQERMETEN